MGSRDLNGIQGSERGSWDLNGDPGIWTGILGSEQGSWDLNGDPGIWIGILGSEWGSWDLICEKLGEQKVAQESKGMKGWNAREIWNQGFCGPRIDLRRSGGVGETATSVSVYSLLLLPTEALPGGRVARFFLVKYTKTGIKYQISKVHINYVYQWAVKYSKLPLNTYSSIFHSKALPNIPKLGFLEWKYTIWQSYLALVVISITDLK
jgi:hypothetical protein